MTNSTVVVKISHMQEYAKRTNTFQQKGEVCAEASYGKNMKNWEVNVRRVTPYTPGEQPSQPDMIKLNTNENPYPPAPGVGEV